MTWDIDPESTNKMMKDVGVTWLAPEDAETAPKPSADITQFSKLAGRVDTKVIVPNAPTKSQQANPFANNSRLTMLPLMACIEHDSMAMSPAGLQSSSDFDPWLFLSDEVVLSVFTWLSKATLSRCACVCKRWKRLAFDESLWRGAIDLGGKTLKRGVVGLVLERGVDILRLAKSEIRAPLNLSSSSFLRPRCYRIQYLDLSMATINPQTLEELLSSCSALRRLSLESCELNNNVCRYIGQNRLMECLNLSMCQGLTENALVPICNNLQRLDSLNVAWTNMSRGAVVYLVISLPSSVTKLNLSGCRDTVQDDDVLQLCTSCPRLSELDLSDSSLVTSSSVEHIVRCLPSLRYLALSRCYMIAQHGIQSLLLLADVPLLEALDVFGMLKEKSLKTLLDALTEKTPNFKLNKCPYSSIARPTTGGDRTKIWGIRTRDRCV
jgi:F-box and leucine-rich repeat protein 1 (S-phase kinase-associated protein 2)